MQRENALPAARTSSVEEYTTPAVPVGIVEIVSMAVKVVLAKWGKAPAAWALAIPGAAASAAASCNFSAGRSI